MSSRQDDIKRAMSEGWKSIAFHYFDPLKKYAFTGFPPNTEYLLENLREIPHYHKQLRDINSESR